MLDETTMDEVIRRATTAGHLRTNHTESKRLIEHLLANGFHYTGPGMTPEPQRIKAHEIRSDGTRVWKR